VLADLHRPGAARWLAAATLVLSLYLPQASSAADALPADTESAHAGIRPQVLQSGLFEILGDAVDEAASRTAAGKVSSHEGEKLRRTTRTLRALKGVAFGFRYRLYAQREGPMHGLEMHVLHPPMRGTDGKMHSVSTAPTDAFFEGGMSDNSIIYILAEDWEVLPGVWTLQVLLDGKVLISRSYRLEP
jgi:Domain of unknown function (DUF3859)